MHLRSLFLTLIFSTTLLCANDTIQVDWIQHTELTPNATNKIVARTTFGDSLVALLRFSTSYPTERNSGAKLFREVYSLNGELLQVTHLDTLDQIHMTSLCTYDQNRLIGLYVKDTLPIIVDLTDSLTLTGIDTLQQYAGSVISKVRSAGGKMVLTSQTLTSPRTTKLVYTNASYEELWSHSDVDNFATNSSGEVLIWENVNRGKIEQEDSTAFPLYNVAIIYSKLTPTGEKQWTGEIDDTLADRAYDAVALPSGDWLLTGASRSSSRPFGGDSYLAIHNINNSTGDRLWKKEYEAPRGEGEEFHPHTDSTILLTGRYSYGSAPIQNGSYSNPWVLLINTSGDTLSTTRYDGEKYTTIKNLSFFDNEHMLINYNESRWVRYDTNLSAIDTGYFSSSAISIPYRPDTYLFASEYANGEILSVGATEQIGHGQFDAFIQIMDTTGKLVKTAVYGDSTNQYAYDIVAHNNNYILTGEWDSTLWVAEINSLGDTLWSRTYDRYSSGRKVTLIGDEILIGGEYLVDSSGTDSLFCIKIDAAGNEIWRTNLTSEENQRASAIAVLPQDLTFTPTKDTKYTFKKGEILFLEEQDSSSTISVLQKSGEKITSLTFFYNYTNMLCTNENLFLTGSKRKETYGESSAIITVYNYAMKKSWEKELGGTKSNTIKKILPQNDGSLVFMGAYQQHFADKFQGASSSYPWLGKLSPDQEILWETHADTNFTLQEDLIALSDKSWITVGYRSPTLYQPPFHSYPGYWYQGASNPIAIKYREGEPVAIHQEVQKLSPNAMTIHSNRIVFHRGFTGEVQIFSLRGQLLQSMPIRETMQSVPLNHLPRGFYVAQFIGEGFVHRMKFTR